MKNILTAFLFLSMGLFVSSCGDDTCDVLSETVVGTWTVDILGTGTVTLKEDGSMSQTDNLIFDPNLDNAELSWKISGSNLILEAFENNGTNFYDFAVSEFDCETVTATYDGNTFIFRKQ